ncbi:hypothetical protein GCM10022231_02630 [Gordonia caeni]|uniref:DUF4190 domain-containing protein n=1 Tax=Gordonia caeni TaxID=1007097 RepID=A0ABP7NMQ0_9ACTN
MIGGVGSPADQKATVGSPDQKTTNYAADRAGESATTTPGSGGKTDPVTRPPARKASPSSSPSTAGPSLSVVAIVGFVLSGIGFFLITVPFGLWLGYRGREETTHGKRAGFWFAKWAIYLGWLWVVFWALALIAYLWILL